VSASTTATIGLLPPFLVFEELLRYRQAHSNETAALANFKHDEVCHKAQEKIEVMLHSFQKYQLISYVVQGPRDQGVDVLFKGYTGVDSPQKFIGLQVKSHRELAQEEGLAPKLKSGLFDARNMYGEGLERYYILLAGDAVKQAKRIGAITNEFGKDKGVRVIGPRSVLAFIELSDATIASVVDRHLRAEDAVRKQARHEVARLTEPELYLILCCICWSLENSKDELPYNFFEDNRRIQQFEEQYGFKEVEACRGRFNDTDFENYAEPVSTRLRLEHYAAVRALYFDLQVRYDETTDGLFEHLFQFLKEPTSGAEDSP
jgi:hypothetical protein